MKGELFYANITRSNDDHKSVKLGGCDQRTEAIELAKAWMGTHQGILSLNPVVKIDITVERQGDSE